MTNKIFNCKGFVIENITVPAFDLHRGEVASILFQQNACDETVLQAKFHALLSKKTTISQDNIPLKHMVASDLNITKMLSGKLESDTIWGRVEKWIERKRLFGLVDGQGKGRRAESLNGQSLSAIALKLCLEGADIVLWDRLTSPLIHTLMKEHLKNSSIIELCPMWLNQVERTSGPNEPNSKIEIISEDHNHIKFWQYYAEAQVVRTHFMPEK